MGAVRAGVRNARGLSMPRSRVRTHQCKFFVIKRIPAANCRNAAYGRRTREAVETAEQRTTDARGEAVVLDRYRLVRRLGEGGCGVVWLAHDERLDRAVAVKRIAVGDEAVAARAEREAIAAARLAHPGIVALYEAGRDDDAVYLVSELVRGRTLAELMAQGALSDRDVLRVGVALCDALAHAHGRGVIHRDVKPGNVMVPDSPQEGAGVVKLTDFGIARVLGDDALTLTGDVVGTLAYMAPEQAEGRPVSEATDLYALGLVLYEALAGVNPVRGRGPAATARRVGVRLPPLSRLRRDLDPAMSVAVDAAVAPRPDERGTLGELRDALADALPHAADERGTIAGSPLEGLPAPDEWRRRGGLWWRREKPWPGHGEDMPTGPWPRLAAAAGAAAVTAAALAWLGPEPALQPLAGAAIAALVAAIVPGLGWLAVATALIAWLATAGAAGLALIAAAAAAPAALLLRGRDGAALLSAPAAAPALGALGIAGAWPALAGQAARPLHRAALGALGFWWLALAEPVAGRHLLVGAAPGTQPRAQWEGSATAAAEHVLAPLASGGALAIAVLWAIGALVLPVLVRGRSAALDLLVAGAWAIALAAATTAIAQSLSWQAFGARVEGPIAGGIAAVLIAVAARACRQRPA